MTYTVVETTTIPEVEEVAASATVFKLAPGEEVVTSQEHREDIAAAANLIEFQSGSQGGGSSSEAAPTYTVVDIDGMGNIQAVKEGVGASEEVNSSGEDKGEGKDKEEVTVQEGGEGKEGEFSTVLFVVRE